MNKKHCEDKSNASQRNVFLETFQGIRRRGKIIRKLLVQTLDEGDEDERLVAVKALGDKAGETDIVILKKVSKEDSSEKVRAVAIHELSFHMDIPDISLAIKAALDDPSPLVRKEAQEVLQNVC